MFIRLLMFLIFSLLVGYGSIQLFRLLWRLAFGRRCEGCNSLVGINDKACLSCGRSFVESNPLPPIPYLKNWLAETFKGRTAEQEKFQEALRLVDQLEAAVLELEETERSYLPKTTATVDPTVPSILVSPRPLSPLTQVADTDSQKFSTGIQQPEFVEISQPSVQEPITATLLQLDRPSELPHALDQDYQTSIEPTAPAKPKRTWSQWFAAFIEEKNIQWGELAGGLLIIGCSAALVISFWDQIASRTWLKFSIFTGINAAVLGVGLHAWHRWRLPMTSQCILMIGLLLLPLNFLAFAIITLGQPWDWLTILGELISLAVLGALAWYATGIVTPSIPDLSTGQLVGFSMSSLLIRRSVQSSSSIGLVVVVAGILGLLYVLSSLWARSRIRRDFTNQTEAEGSDQPQQLRSLGLGSFGLILCLGLLIGCSGRAREVAQACSPFLPILSLPLLTHAVAGLRAESLRKGKVLSLCFVSVATAIGVGSLIGAWPSAVLISLCCWIITGILGYVHSRFRQPEWAYVWLAPLTAALYFGWFGLTSPLSWNNQSTTLLLKTVFTVSGGFVLAVIGLVLGCAWFYLSRIDRQRESTVALRSAGVVTLLGVLQLCLSGLGREAYAASIASLFGFYAIALLFFAEIRKRPWLDWMASLFIAFGSFQAVSTGFLSQQPMLIGMYWSLVTTAGLLLAAIVARQTIVGRIVGRAVQPDSPLPTAAQIALGLATFASVCWFIADRADIAGRADWAAPRMDFSSRVIAPQVVLYLLAAWVLPSATLWIFGLVILLLTGSVKIFRYSQLQAWYPPESQGWLHPHHLQLQVIWLACVGGLFVLADSVARWFRRIGRLGEIAKRFLNMQTSDIGRAMLTFATIAVVALNILSVQPAAMQELTSMDPSLDKQEVAFVVDGSEQRRLVPDIRQFRLKPSWDDSLGLASPSLKWASIPLCLWAIAAVAGALTLSTFVHRHQPYSVLLCIVLMSAGLPVATRWQGDIAVGSAIRWISSGSFFLITTYLLLIYARRQSTRPNLGIRWERSFDKTLGASLQALLVIWLSLIGYVLVAAVWRALATPYFIVISGLFAVLGFLGASLIAVGPLSDQEPPAARKSRFSVGLVMLTLAVAWFVLLGVQGLKGQPPTGPNPGSFFATIGLAPSYSLPMVVIAIALVAAAALRPSPTLAFTAGILFQIAAIAGFMLIVKSNAILPGSWLLLLVTIALAGTAYGLLWRFYSRSWPFSWHDPNLNPRMRLLEDLRDKLQGVWNQTTWAYCWLALAILMGYFLISPQASSHLLLGSLAIPVAFGACHLSQRYLNPSMLAGGASSVVRALMGVSLCISLGIGLSLYLNPWINATLASSIALLLLQVYCWRRLDRNTRTLEFASSGIAAYSTALVVGPFLSLSNWFLIAALSIVAMGHWLVLVRATVRLSYHVIASLLAHFAVICLMFGIFQGIGTSLLINQFQAHVLCQISVAALLSAVGAMIGLRDRTREQWLVAVRLFLCYGILIFSVTLLFGFASTDRISVLVVTASCVIACFVGILQRDAAAQYALYLTLFACALACISFFGSVLPTHPSLASIALAAFALATSYLWSKSDKMREVCQRFAPRLFQCPVDQPSVKRFPGEVIYCNLAVVLLVTALGVGSQWFETIGTLRFAAAQSIWVSALSIGICSYWLQRWSDAERVDGDQVNTEPSAVSFLGFSTHSALSRLTSGELLAFLRTIALGIGAVSAVAIGWALAMQGRPLHPDHAATAGLSLTIIGIAYGFGFVKWVGFGESWARAALRLVPLLLVIGIGCLGFSIAKEFQLVSSQTPITQLSTSCVLVSLILLIAIAVIWAVLPGRDPLSLSLVQREVYVYVAQGLLVLTILHVRLSIPWLFEGWLSSLWPLFIMGLAAVGILSSRWAAHYGLQVLVRPLERSSAFLPLVPVLAHAALPSRIPYGGVLLTAAFAYGLFAWIRKSWWYSAAAVLAANGSLWYLLYQSNFRISDHPQLWVIPPALSLIVFAQLLRDRLKRRDVTIVRYLAAGSMYLSSTIELVMHGISENPWLPVVLAVLSLAGILAGIGLRVRALMWLGSFFLAVAIFSIIWHAAVDLEQTWIWYVAGLIMGVLMLTVFALFEKRKERLTEIAKRIETWDQ